MLDGGRESPNASRPGPRDPEGEIEVVNRGHQRRMDVGIQTLVTVVPVAASDDAEYSSDIPSDDAASQFGEFNGEAQDVPRKNEALAAALSYAQTSSLRRGKGDRLLEQH